MPGNPTSFVVYPWSPTADYKANDIISGNGGYYYATQDNINQAPFTDWTLSGAGWTRTDGKIRIETTTINPPLTRGSFVNVSGINNIGFTGTLTNGGSNWLEYPNPGPNDSGEIPIRITSDMNPAWTSGFGWIPSYTTNIDVNTKIVEVQYDGYSQRMRNSLNSNQMVFNMQFDDRTDREVVAICNYIEDKGGVDTIRINAGSALLGGKPTAKYIGLNPKISPKSHNVTSVSVTVSQVFDI